MSILKVNTCKWSQIVANEEWLGNKYMLINRAIISQVKFTNAAKPDIGKLIEDYHTKKHTAWDSLLGIFDPPDINAMIGLMYHATERVLYSRFILSGSKESYVRVYYNINKDTRLVITEDIHRDYIFPVLDFISERFEARCNSNMIVVFSAEGNPVMCTMVVEPSHSDMRLINKLPL